MFTVGPWEFYQPGGYTFPTIFNPISVNEGEQGQELGETGEEVDWSGENVQLDPLEGWNSLMNYLQADPTEVTYPTVQEFAQAVIRLGTAYWDSWYPFVPQSYLWNPAYSISAYLWRPFAPFLCPSCNPEDPFLPPVPETSSVPEPDSARMVTMNVASPSAGDVLKNIKDLDNEQESLTAEQDGLAVDGTATNAAGVLDHKVSPPVVADPAGVLDKVSPPVVPNADQGPDTATPVVDATTVVEKPESTTATSTIVITDGNKVIPGQVGPKHRKPGGGLAGAMKSLQDTISKVTDGLTGGGTTNAGDTTNSSEASTGNTGG
jgi:hypothetical protein